MLIGELLDVTLLDKMVEEKYVRFNTHAEFPELRIYEYTEKCVYDRMWNDVTLKTRGLIVNWSTGEILARPFDKFFNYGESSVPVALSLNDDVIVHDKMDGSLGILYRRPDGFLAIATKGSFHSEQAQWATKEIRKYMTTHFREDEVTWLFEIIYPENKIVVSYNFSGLVLLGARDIESGADYFPDELLDWKGRKATQFRYNSLREALEASPRLNAEGFVVYLPEMDIRVKIKQEDYLILHRAVSHFNIKRVYDMMTEGMSLEQMSATLPDELHDELKLMYSELAVKFMKIRSQVLKDFINVYEPDMTKKEFALKVKAGGYAYPSFMFSMFDKVPDYVERVWKSIDPRRSK